MNPLLYNGTGSYPMNIDINSKAAKLNNYLSGTMAVFQDVSRLQAQAQQRVTSNYSPIGNHYILHVSHYETNKCF